MFKTIIKTLIFYFIMLVVCIAFLSIVKSFLADDLNTPVDTFYIFVAWGLSTFSGLYYLRSELKG